MERQRFLRQSSLFLILMMMLTLLVAGMIFTIEPSQTEASAPKNKEGGPTIGLVEIANGFDQIVDLAHAGDERLFVVEQSGHWRCEAAAEILSRDNEWCPQSAMFDGF